MSAPTDGEAGTGDATSFPSYDENQQGQFAAKFNFLFRKRQRPLSDAEYAKQKRRTGNAELPRGFREWHNQEVAKEVGLSDAFIGYLRRGIKTNPSFSNVNKLAKFFRVPAQFLFDVDEDYSTAALELKLAELEAEIADSLVFDEVSSEQFTYGLNVLFATIVPPGGDSSARYTEEQVAEGIGVEVTLIRELREGSTMHLDIEVARALAQFFGVDPIYLIGDPSDKRVAETDEDLARLRMLNETNIRSIAARLSNLKPENRAAVAKIVDFFEEEERKQSDNQDKLP